MRKAGSIACALLVAACGSQEPQTDDALVAANGPVQEANVAAAEPVRNEAGTVAAVPATPQASVCRMQDGQAVTHTLKALGTEPFWSAEIEGRCVTYTTPEDQRGTRVWTKVSENAPSIVWDGALRGKQFQLAVTPKSGCSDGMSDKSYPMEVVLRVDGETRHGCAETR